MAVHHIRSFCDSFHLSPVKVWVSSLECMCPSNHVWHQHSHLLEIVKQTEGEYLTFLAYCSIFQMTTLTLKHSFQYDQKWGRSSLSPPHRFPQHDCWWDVWQNEIVPQSCQTAAQLCPCIGLVVVSVSLHLPLTAPPFSPHFHPFKKDNDNGFYLMFFLLSHFPICSPICQCHLCPRLSECSFTPATRVVLTSDDDVDRGDGLHECKFIYVALLLPNQFW